MSQRMRSGNSRRRTLAVESLERRLLLQGDLAWSTFLGDPTTVAWSVAVGRDGGVFVAGDTSRPPAGGSASRDAFVAKLSPSGDRLIWTTFLAGSGGDFVHGKDQIALDDTGNVYVAGMTRSADFPTTPGAFDRTLDGVSDGFVAKLDPNGQMLWSTFVGGTGAEAYCCDPAGAADFASAIAVDESGVYVGGHTRSVDFPTTPGALDPHLAGGWDGFVMKINQADGLPIWSTLLGGGNDEHMALEVDGAGRIYVFGTTLSPDFPTTPDAYDMSFNGGTGDGFVARMNATGSGLDWSTFLGGQSWDSASSLAIDPSGVVYVGGVTSSPDYPTTADALDRSYGGGPASCPSTNGIGSDGFVAELNPGGDSLRYSTYLGGSNCDRVSAVAVDSVGTVHVTGSTASSDFPITEGAFDSTHNGAEDAFLAKLSPLGHQVTYSTFLGGVGHEEWPGMALDPHGNVYLGGYTVSPDFPTTLGALDTSYSGGPYDAFVAKISFGPTVWDLSTDFQSSPNQQNPNPDRVGNSSVWHFMMSNNVAIRDGDYSLIPHFDSPFPSFDLGWSPVTGLEAWVTPTVRGEYTPLVSKNVSGRDVAIFNFIWPNGTTTVHPGRGRLAIVGWRSPISGTVAVSGGIMDLDPNCGDGVSWFIDKNSSPADSRNLAYGGVANGAAEDFSQGLGGQSLAQVPVGTGDWLYFVLSPAGSTRDATNYFCDTTQPRITITALETAPQVVKADPSGTVRGPIEQIDLTFSESIDPGTFKSADDIVSFTGPNGAIVPSGEPRALDNTNTTFRITFPSQTAPGTYTLTIGPDIRDLAGNPMDQDRDGEQGQVPDDRFTASLTVVELVDGYDLPFPDRDRYCLYYDIWCYGNSSTKITQQHGEPADFTLPDGTRITGYHAGDDIAGGLASENSPVAAVAHGTIVDSRVDDGSGKGWGNAWLVEHTEEGPEGTLIKRYSLYAHLARFAAGLGGGSQVGRGQVIGYVGSTGGSTNPHLHFAIKDDPGFGQGYYSDGVPNTYHPPGPFIVDHRPPPERVGPRAISATPNGNVLGPVSKLEVTFSEPINRSSFTTAEIVALAGPNGAIMPISGPDPINEPTTTFRIRFPEQTAPGTYTLVIAVDIRDLRGNPMDQDQNGTNGEVPQDRYTTTMSILDTDGDGLSDLWEMLGIDFNGDGLIDLDLPALGADPNHKDLFVEVDAMVGRDPVEGVLDRVEAAFAAAPNSLVNNPDGRDGVTLHLELDETDIPLADWSDLDASGWPKGFDQVKANKSSTVPGGFGTRAERADPNAPNLLRAKSLAFRYAIFANSYGTTRSSGRSELPGNDFFVTLGRWQTPGGTADQRAGTFMHEFGHALGLGHGGADAINCKPNYHSVMNYTWTVPLSGFVKSWVLDYSRRQLPNQSEGDLNESIGVGGDSALRVPVGPRPAQPVSEGGPVDWNRNGSIDPHDSSKPIKADINFMSDLVSECTASPDQILRGYEDWSNLRYTIGGHSNFDDGVLRDSPIHEEMTLEQYQVLNEIANSPPILDPIADRVVDESDVVSFVVTASDTDPDQTLTFHLDAAPPGATIDPITGRFSWTPPDGPAITEVTVRVTDSGTPRLSDAKSFPIQVNNVAPMVTLVGPATANEGDTKAYSFTVSDPGADTFSLTSIDCGINGTMSNSSFNSATRSGSFDCTYSDDSAGSTVSLTVSDDGGGAGSDSLVVSVNNVPPVIASISNSSPECGTVREGQAIKVSGTFADAGTGDTHTAAVNWGDGSSSISTSVTESGGSGSATASHPYTNGGIYPITVTVSDDDGTLVSRTTTAMITGAGVRTGDLQIVGTDGDDNVKITRRSKATFKVQANFLASGKTRAFGATDVTHIIVMLCDGDDRAHEAGNIGTSTIMDGGAGDDRLKGGRGWNVLLGAEGTDVLTGGNNRDLLIGGADRDRLVANTGEDNNEAEENVVRRPRAGHRVRNADEDILIGGMTFFDIDDDHVTVGFDEALSAILAEWNSTRAYAARVANIRGTGSGTRLNGSFFLQNGVSVLDDAVADGLIGSGGEDWFFYKSTQDKLIDRKSEELVN